MKKRLLTLIMLAVGAVALAGTAKAAEVTNLTDDMTRHKEGETATHTIEFTQIDTGAVGDTLVLDFSSSFSITTASVSSVVGSISGDYTLGTVTVDDTINEIEIILNTAPDAETLTVVVGGVVNPGIGSYAVRIEGSYGATGGFMVPITQEDQVDVYARTLNYITFDLDVSDIDEETNGPYLMSGPTYGVDLGILDYSTINTADRKVYVDLDTNVPNGADVDVISAYAGLQSVTNPSDSIDSVSGSGVTLQTDEDEGAYGMYVSSTTLGTSTSLSVDTSNYPAAAGTVGGLNTTWTRVLYSNDTLSDARAELTFQGVGGKLEAAHDDYKDVLTFRATANY